MFILGWHYVKLGTP